MFYSIKLKIKNYENFILHSIIGCDLMKKYKTIQFNSIQCNTIQYNTNTSDIN